MSGICCIIIACPFPDKGHWDTRIWPGDTQFIKESALTRDKGGRVEALPADTAPVAQGDIWRASLARARQEGVNGHVRLCTAPLCLAERPTLCQIPVEQRAYMRVWQVCPAGTAIAKLAGALLVLPAALDTQALIHLPAHTPISCWSRS